MGWLSVDDDVIDRKGIWRRPRSGRERERGDGEVPAALRDGSVRSPLGLFGSALVSFSITWLRLKLPGFWRGGNSLKLCIHSPTYMAAGPTRKARSSRQLL